MSLYRSLVFYLTTFVALALFAATATSASADHLRNADLDLVFVSPVPSTPTDQPVVISGVVVTSRAADHINDQVVLTAKNLDTGQHWDGTSWISNVARFESETTITARNAAGQPERLEFTSTLPATGHRLWITAQVRNNRFNFQDEALQLNNIGSGPIAQAENSFEGTIVHRIVLTSPIETQSTTEPIRIVGTSTLDNPRLKAKDLATGEWWYGRIDRPTVIESRIFGVSVTPVPGTSPQLYQFSATIPATGQRMWINVHTVEFTGRYDLLSDTLSIQLNNTAPTTTTSPSPSPQPTVPAAGDAPAGAIRVTSIPGQIFRGGRLDVSGYAAGTPYGNTAPAVVQLFIRDLDTDRYWDGAAWTDTFTMIEAELRDAGVTAAGAEVVSFQTVVPDAPARRIDLRIRTITTDRRFSSFTPFRTSLN